MPSGCGKRGVMNRTTLHPCRLSGWLLIFRRRRLVGRQGGAAGGPCLRAGAHLAENDSEGEDIHRLIVALSWGNTGERLLGLVPHLRGTESRAKPGHSREPGPEPDPGGRPKGFRELVPSGSHPSSALGELGKMSSTYTAQDEPARGSERARGRVPLDSAISQLCAPGQTAELLWASNPKRGCIRRFISEASQPCEFPEPQLAALASVSISHKRAPHVSPQHRERGKRLNQAVGA